MAVLNPFSKDVFNYHFSSVTNPGAGNQIDFTPPANARAELLWCQFQLATDANVSNRILQMYLNNGSVTMYINASPVMHVASTTYMYVAGQHLQPTDNTARNYILLPLPVDLMILEGWTIETVLTGGQAGDTYTAIRQYWKFWPYEQ